MACDCIERVDKQMAEKNSRLVLGFTFSAGGRPGYEFPALSTEKIEKRKRESMGAIPSFCPFCGTPYRSAPSAA